MYPSTTISRRQLLQSSATYAAATWAAPVIGNAQERSPGTENKVQLSQIHGQSEPDESARGPYLPPDKRVGYAIVGLGRLSIDQILPAFGSSRYSRPVAFVSGDRSKALKLAHQYGISESAIYNYTNYEQLASNPQIQAVYIVLPNGLHEEYVMRAAQIHKHVLCEKPMANSSAQGPAHDR